MLRFHWTEEITAELIRFRRLGHNTENCATHIGVSVPLTAAKLKELGLNGRLHRGPIPGTATPTYTPPSRDDRNARRRAAYAANPDAAIKAAKSFYQRNRVKLLKKMKERYDARKSARRTSEGLVEGCSRSFGVAD